MTPNLHARYDRRTIALHWATAVMALFMWCGAHAIDWFPKGPLRIDARSVHIVVGVALAALLIARVAWRLAGGVRIREPHTALWLAAHCIHLALYGLLGATLLLGIANAWVRGDSLFGLVHIPAWGDDGAAARHALSSRIVGFHALGANLLLLLAGAHATVALFHHFALRDGVLRRMIPS